MMRIPRRNFSFWYWLSSWWMRTGWYFVFRRMDFTGIKNIPFDKPLVFAPNHQNAFMDAFSTAGPILNYVQLYFMVRADVFKSRIGSFFLREWRLIPAYRMRDGVENLGKNNEVFDRVQDLLQKHNSVIVYPEANHDIPRRLRPLKKGLARIVLAMDDRYGAENVAPVMVVPVGMNYTDPHHFGGDLCVNYGDPIDVAPYRAMYRENPARALTALMNAIAEAMRPLMIDIRTQEYYDTVEECLHMWVNHTLGRNTRPFVRFQEDKKLIAALEPWLESNPEQAQQLKADVQEYQQLRQSTGFRDWLFDFPGFSTGRIISELLLLVLFFPMYLVGAMWHAWPLALGNRVALKRIKDPGFRSSIIWSFVIVLVSFNYYLTIILGVIFLDPWWLAFPLLAGAHVCGWIWLKWARGYTRIKAMINFNAFISRKAQQHQRMATLRNNILDCCRKAVQAQ
jgi:1-acyl-sn-glycerol-3-phosphate acyltransferase